MVEKNLRNNLRTVYAHDAEIGNHGIPAHSPQVGTYMAGSGSVLRVRTSRNVVADTKATSALGFSVIQLIA